VNNPVAHPIATSTEHLLVGTDDEEPPPSIREEERADPFQTNHTIDPSTTITTTTTTPILTKAKNLERHRQTKRSESQSAWKSLTYQLTKIHHRRNDKNRKSYERKVAEMFQSSIPFLNDPEATTKMVKHPSLDEQLITYQRLMEVLTPHRLESAFHVLEQYQATMDRAEGDVDHDQSSSRATTNNTLEQMVDAVTHCRNKGTSAAPIMPTAQYHHILQQVSEAVLRLPIRKMTYTDNQEQQQQQLRYRVKQGSIDTTIVRNRNTQTI